MSNERLGCAFKQNSQPKVTDTGDANTPAALTVKETEGKKKGEKRKRKKAPTEALAVTLEKAPIAACQTCT